MADKTIIVEIRALVNNLTSQLKSAVKGVNDFAASNSRLSKTFGILSTSQRKVVTSMKGWSDGVKAVAKGFSKLDSSSKTLAHKYTKLSTENKRLGESYHKLNSNIINGSVKATASQAQTISLWNKLTPSIKGTLTQFNKAQPSVQRVVSAFSGLNTTTRSTITSFSRFAPHLQKAHSSILNFGRGANAAQKSGKSFGSIFASIGKSVFSFNAVSRVAAGSARALGTSLIFSGGAFRNLGVFINIGASALQAFIPLISGVLQGVVALGARLGSLGPIGIAAAAAITGAFATVALTVAQIGASIAVLAVAGFGLGAIISEGIKFNQTMESAAVTIGTLIAEYKDLSVETEKNGVRTTEYIGKVKALTKEQFRALTPAQQQQEIDKQRNAATLRITAAMDLAKQATVALTAAAADSVFTTKELMGGFRATFTVLGKYGVTAAQAANLTVQLARVASVAGVSAANMASQFTLFLRGVGRVTSPLAAFASGIGLTREEMKRYNEEFNKFKNNPVETQKIISELTMRLTAFNVGGRLMSDTWQGIMSNMTENFQLFSGLVTTGFFNTVRDSIFNVQKDVDGAVTHIGGALSKLFDIDPKTGTFKETVKEIRDLFTEPLQKASDVIQRLVQTIGTDVASVVGWLTDKIIEIADWISKNEIKIQSIYFEVKGIVLLILDLIVGWAGFLGISRDLNTTLNDTQSNLQTIQGIISFIGDTINVIALLLASILVPVTLMWTIITAVLETLYNIVLVVVNFGIWVANIVRTLQGIKEQTDYLAIKWNFLATVAGWVAKWWGVGAQALDNMKSSADELAKIESGRAGVLADQNRRLLLQSRLYEQVKSEASNKDNPLFGKSEADLARETRNRLMTVGSTEFNVLREQFQKRNYVLKNSDDALVFRNEEIELDLETAKELAKGKPNIIETPKDRPDGGGGGGKKEKIQRRILDTLFDEEKERSEARIALQLTLFEITASLDKKKMEIFLATLDDQLEEGEKAFTDYYEKIGELSEREFRNEDARIKSAMAALEQRYVLEQRSLEQDRLNAQVELSIADSNHERAKALREIEAINIRTQTAEIKFSEEKAKLDAEEKQRVLSLHSVQLGNLRKLRDATREFFKEVRDIRRSLDELLDDPFNTDALEFGLSEITRKYAGAFMRMEAIRTSTTSTLEQKQFAEDSINRLARLESIERERLVTKQLMARLEVETIQLERDRSILEIKRTRGYITEAEFIEQNNKLRLDSMESYAKKIEELEKRLEDVRANDKNGDRLKDILALEKEIFDTKVLYNEALDVTETKLLEINNTLRDGLSDFLETVLDDVRNVGEAFTNLGKHIQKTIQRALIDRLINNTFMDKIFGNKNQTEGRAQGIGSITRKQALDVNSKFSNKDAKGGLFDSSGHVIVGATINSTLDGRAIPEIKIDPADVKIQEAKDRFAVAVNQIKDETLSISTEIDSLQKNFTTLGDAIEDVASRIRAIPLPTATEPPVITDGKTKGGSGSVGTSLKGTSSPSSKAQEVLDFVKRPNKMDGVLRGVANTLASETGESADDIFLLLKATWGRETSGQIHFKKNASGAQGPFQLTADRTTHTFEGDALLAGRQLLKGQGGKGGFIRNGLGTFADYFAGPNGGNRGAKTAAYQRDQQWVFTNARGITEDKGSTPSNPVYVTPVSNTSTESTSDGVLTQISEKLGSGLAVELTTFLTNLAGELSTKVTSPIITAIRNMWSPSNTKTLASGGYISGPGGPTEDKVPAWLSNGEFVVKSAAVKALGLDKLHAINNADKALPQFGFGGVVSGIFKSLGGFLKTDAGKLVAASIVPMIAQRFLGDKAATAMSLALPFLFGLGKGKGKNKITHESQHVKDLYQGKASGGLISKMATGGLVGNGAIHKVLGSSVPRFNGGTPVGFWKGANGQAIKGGAITAAISIGMAILGRLLAKKQPKSDPNRKKDPFGFNPDTLTFYKKPIITGSRNFLAKGGFINSQKMLDSMPRFATGGLNDSSLEDIVNSVQNNGENPMTINQNINITTPDVHSFRNSRGQLERDLARVTQRGLKRRAPKY